MIEQKHFNQMCIMDENYGLWGIEEVNRLIEEGKKIIAEKGDVDLNNKLKTQEEFRSTGALFCYELALDESLYEDEGK